MITGPGSQGGLSSVPCASAGNSWIETTSCFGFRLSGSSPSAARPQRRFSGFDPLEDLADEAPWLAARRANQFCFSDSGALDLSSPRAKNIVLSYLPKSCSTSPRSAPMRGAHASSRTWSGMRWTRGCWRRAALVADDEIVWSWRAKARAKFLRDSKGCAWTTVARAGSPRRARHKP